MKGRCRVIAIKKNIELVPWADVVYGCDGPWWISVNGLPDFRGLKVCYEKNNLSLFPEIRRIGIEVPTDRLLFEKIGKVGSGGNSGFQALNLALQWGAKDIILIVFDMTGPHWYGKNRWTGANNPDESNFRRWRDAFGVASKQCHQMGVKVVNCSPVSALACFPKMSLTEALA